MKKILFVAAIIASCATFVSCDADSFAEEISQSGQQADDSGGEGGTTPIKPPPPIVTIP